ncbi:DUF1308 domain-containing protein [Phototrophicus methaneseepsis]|uniref:DUF1308 domain-containing protein n=2 Tax=Phototrophicus methaneseepsis TaxID=2710758 RepID=A0A7S8E8Z7_9CHLR|nr:DUF1308 domain-containing protein [Phototrophicus methaneseepsis]
MTSAAAAEFAEAVLKHAGVTEMAGAGIHIVRVQLIQNDPSSRVLQLPDPNLSRIADKIIFGTGDKLGIKTMTGDTTFVKHAKSNGVILDVYEHSPARFRGV